MHVNIKIIPVETVRGIMMGVGDEIEQWRG
jgi:hypothetical protein